MIYCRKYITKPQVKSSWTSILLKKCIVEFALKLKILLFIISECMILEMTNDKWETEHKCALQMTNVFN